MTVLITAGPTHEPIDRVRYIANRSSGQMGAALAAAAIEAGHRTTLILGPSSAPMPPQARRIDVRTAREMHEAVLRQFPGHDLLIMAAAVADFRPVAAQQHKLPRGGSFTLELEPTEDILAAAAAIKRPDQRTVGFSLVHRDDLSRSREKLARKRLDLIVHNPLETMNSRTIESILIYPGGREQILPQLPKPAFAAELIRHCQALFPLDADSSRKNPDPLQKQE